MEPIQDQPELDLAIRTSPDIIPINGKCTLKKDGVARVVYVAGLPVHHWTADDRRAEASAMVNLVMSGFADQNEVALAFKKTSRTLRRLQRRFEAGGTEGLGRTRGRPQETQSAPSPWVRSARVLQRAELGVRAIAHRLGIGKTAVSKWLARANREATRATARQAVAPEIPSHAAPVGRKDGVVPHADVDPEHRWLDRLLARLGKLNDAEPIFTPGRRIPHAGVLLAVPALTQSGIFSVAEEVYGHIAPAFYGLRTTMMAMLLMALLRIKRPEALKEHAPVDLGRVLGLDRGPEVKTLRRKLTRLAAYGRAEVFGRKLAQRRVARRGRALGFLYMDGHVRVYHGSHRLPKAHVTRMRLALPATTDYWVNDKHGDPLFVVTAEFNEGLVQMLPALAAEIRSLVGPHRRVTVVFDRGGWSPKLFAKLIKARFDILTYRKGRWKNIPATQFVPCAKRIDGRKVNYDLNDRNVRLLKGRLRLRQITRLSADGHQTPIMTSRWDLPAVVLAYRMFERWRQENFFKYLREEFALDALVDYEAEPVDPERTVPNPERRKAEKDLALARAELRKAQTLYGEAAVANKESRRPTIRGFKIAHGKLGRRIREIQGRIGVMEEKRSLIPKRVPAKDVAGKPIMRLSRERKHLTNCIEMVAYQAESDLLALLRPHYARADEEGRTLVTSAFESAGDLQVGDGELRVTLAPLSSLHRSRAVAALCEALNGMDACFPGTKIKLRFGVAS